MLSCDLLVMAVGIRPNCALMKEAGLVANPNILSVGECASRKICDAFQWSCASSSTGAGSSFHSGNGRGSGTVTAGLSITIGINTIYEISEPEGLIIGWTSNREGLAV